MHDVRVVMVNYPEYPDSSGAADRLEADLNRKHFHRFRAKVLVRDYLNFIAAIRNVESFALVIAVRIAASNDQAVKVTLGKARHQSLYPVAVNETVFFYLFPTFHGVKVFPLNG